MIAMAASRHRPLQLCESCRSLDFETLLSKRGITLHNDWRALTMSAASCRLCAWIVAEVVKDMKREHHRAISSRLSGVTSPEEYQRTAAYYDKDPLEDESWYSGRDTEIWMNLITGDDRKLGLQAHIGRPESGRYDERDFAWEGNELVMKDIRTAHIIHYFVFPGKSMC